MKFDVLTLFPEQIEENICKSITGRALSKGVISLKTVNMRDFCGNSYGKVDDTIYGGGTGLLITARSVYDSWHSLFEKDDDRPYTVYVSPKGSVLNQQKVIELSKKKELCIICGHYEGIDSRAIDAVCDEEISIGDYVLTGGELAACVIIDSVSRMIEGVLPNEDAFTNESHMDGTLEAPQYTMPSEWKGMKVPEVLLSGNDAAIDEHRRTSALVETWVKRPDMLDKLDISEPEWQKMLALRRTL
ncbi:MAG: tRNA (guanosine(37)-N1)-methyltransferase TrmD [Clostridiales bacterium]|nr:tRNA (guanosine(37)-N1)-methyltransferase TrmD [Clostridiales bacterium]